MDQPIISPMPGSRIEPPVSSTSSKSGQRANSASVLMRAIMGAATLGAGVIHLALVPNHAAEWRSLGIAFAVAGWAQLALAAALFLRPSRVAVPFAALLNMAAAAAWTVNVTRGFPFGPDKNIAETADTLGWVTLGLEVIAVLAGIAALSDHRPFERLAPAWGFGATVVSGFAVSMALVSPTAIHSHTNGAHSETAIETAASGGHSHGTTDSAQFATVSRSERCDLAFNTKAFNDEAVPGVPHAHDDTQPVDFTLDEWAEEFVSDKVTPGMTPAGVAAYLKQPANAVQAQGILSGGLTHTLTPDPWIPMTNQEECDTLRSELIQAREIAAKYYTAADAIAAGYRPVTDYLPGISGHYMNFSYVDGTFEIDKPEMLLFDGNGPDAHIQGLSYYVVKPGEEEPSVGFAGPNDHYHVHKALCIAGGKVVGGSTTTPEQCAELGGSKASAGGAGWMNHVWVVPGCESDWGLFSGANPALKVGMENRSGEPGSSGCMTGKTMDDKLTFEGGDTLRPSATQDAVAP